MSKPKKPPPEQLSLFGPVDAPAQKAAEWDPKQPDYRPLWEPRPPTPAPRAQPTVEAYDVQRAPLAQKHSRTSVEAANLMSGTRAGTLRATIWRWLLEQGERGGTDEEGQDALGLEGNTYRPRRVELQEAGLVITTVRTRRTRSNRQAAVWRAVRPEGA